MEPDLFYKSKEYFLIDSVSLEDCASGMYGFCILDGHIYTTFEDLGERLPNGAGSYLYVRRDKTNIEILQDYIGSIGLFLFRDGDYFALSNNFLYLLDHLKKNHALHFNNEYSDAFLVQPICSFQYGETMVREIEWLDRHARVQIDIPSKTLSLSYASTPEKTIPIDSAEGIRLLDAWYEYWVEVIVNAQTEYPAILQTAISGGFDTRMLLTLFLHPSVDRSRIYFFSKTDQLRNHKEDFRIAQEIASLCNIHLNDDLLNHQERRNLTARDIVAQAVHNNFSSHKQFQLRSQVLAPVPLIFGGHGGELFRADWEEKSVAAYQQKELLPRAKTLYGNKEAERIRRVFDTVQDSADRILAHYREHRMACGEPEGCQRLLFETYIRIHCGPNAHSMHEYHLSPLLDQTLLRIAETKNPLRDSNLLPALVYARYAPDLLDVAIEGGRRIEDETKAYARKICRENPYRPDSTSKRPETIAPREDHQARHNANLYPKELWDAAKKNPQLHRSVGDDIVNRAFLSPTIRNAFTSVYGRSVYRKIKHEAAAISWHPYANWHAALCVALTLLHARSESGDAPDMDVIDHLFACAEEVSAEEYQKELHRLHHSAGHFLKRKINAALRKMKHFIKRQKNNAR